MWRWALIGLAVLGVIAVAVWYWTDIRVERQARSQSSTQTPLSIEPTASSIAWAFMGSSWKAMGNAPDCPESLVLKSPVDLGKATAILYPGQARGGNYKPHGGFRFADNTNADVTVTAPIDASLVGGSRYLEGGEVQYLLEFVNSCGIMYRFDHLLTLTPTFQAIVEQFPEPRTDDSRTSTVSPPVAVTEGETIGTAVGFAATGNTSVDFGVYDLRAKNSASGLPPDDQQLAPYAVCWFDLLSTPDEATVRALPAGDSESGTTSNYCRR